MRALIIAWKDVKRTYRDLPALAMMLAAPLVLATLLGAAFGGSGSTFSIEATKVVVANLDRSSAGAARPGEAGATILVALKSPDLSELLSVSAVGTVEAARKAVDDGTDSVAVIIPADLTAVLASPQQRTAAVVIYKDPTRTLGPAIATSVVQRVIDGLNGVRVAASTTAQLAIQAGVTDAASIERAASSAAGDYAQATGNGQGSVEIQAREPRLPGEAPSKEVGVTAQVLAGMLVFFTFIAATNVARGVLEEERMGTLQRLFTTPTPRTTILGGKLGSVFLVVAIQTIILLAAGRLIFAIHWGGLLPVAILVLLGAAAAAGLGIFLVSLTKTIAQAGAIPTGAILVLALLGGNFVGTTNPGGVFRVLRRLTPNGWLLEGWDSTMRGGGAGELGMVALAVSAFAIVTFLVGVLMFRRRFA